MWYLQTDVLLRLLIATGIMILISGLSRLIFKKDFSPKVLIFADIAVIAYVSWQLALFSIGYTLITFIFARILKPLKKSRRFFFVFFSILCTVPFFYGRMTEFFPQIPVIITFVGIAYHMLKAVDAMYFVYYADMKIPFLTYVNYMLFFPTFTSGPIFRYRDFQKVFNKPVPLTADRFIMCVKRFIKGMFKKMVVLYFVSTFFAFLVGLEKHWYISLSIVVFSYLFLFFDLSGYSDIAIAVGSVMGYTVPENFRKPWAAASFTQFWRNWHITLSDWVREHIFVVLNGKRLGRLASAGMGFLVMFVMEMWHGFSLPYIVGGVYNGLCLGLENLFGLTTVDKRKMNKAVYVIRCIIVNALFAFNTLLFTVTTEQFFEILKGFIRL
ncbi:MAG: MBOAT family O-acyltransferase [Hominilimicola sp.]